jgi:hypothetical protein
VNAWCAGPGVMILSASGSLLRRCWLAAGLAAMSAVTRIAAQPAEEGAEWPEMAQTEARRDQGPLLKGLASPWKEFASAARRRARSVYSLPGSRPESSSPLFLFSLCLYMKRTADFIINRLGSLARCTLMQFLSYHSMTP